MTCHPTFKDSFHILELVALKETDKPPVDVPLNPTIISKFWDFLRVKIYFKIKIESILKAGWVQNLKSLQD